MMEQDKTKSTPELFGHNTKQKLSKPTSQEVYFSVLANGNDCSFFTT